MSRAGHLHISDHALNGKGTRMDKRALDMHTHTSASDGKGSALDLLRASREKGLCAVAVTDHDTVESAQWCYGYMRHVAESGADADVVMVPGVEFSSYIDNGQGVDIVHVLGLGIDPYEDGLCALCDGLRLAHKEQLSDLIEVARTLGLGLDPDAEARVLMRSSWGRGDIAREEVLMGRFESVHEAYVALWGTTRDYVDLRQYIPSEQAIEAIHQAGGLAVLGHPLRDEVQRCMLPFVDAIRRIDTLEVCGLDGVECFYSSFGLEQCEGLLQATRERSLLVSAGSDHHDYNNRFRLGRTCDDGRNYGYRTDILEALGLGSAIVP